MLDHALSSDFFFGHGERCKAGQSEPEGKCSGEITKPLHVLVVRRIFSLDREYCKE